MSASATQLVALRLSAAEIVPKRSELSAVPLLLVMSDSAQAINCRWCCEHLLEKDSKSHGLSEASQTRLTA